jgi:hypothetical protein
VTNVDGLPPVRSAKTIVDNGPKENVRFWRNDSLHQKFSHISVNSV